jgi:hypothetical protein
MDMTAQSTLAVFHTNDVAIHGGSRASCSCMTAGKNAVDPAMLPEINVYINAVSLNFLLACSVRQESHFFQDTSTNSSLHMLVYIYSFMSKAALPIQLLHNNSCDLVFNAATHVVPLATMRFKALFML